MAFDRLKFVEKNFSSIPFTSKEYFITTHESIYDKIDFRLMIKSIIKLVCSVSGSLWLKNNKQGDYFVYHGGLKTKLEMEKLFSEGLSIHTVSDKHTDNSDSAKRFSSLIYVLDKKFIKIFNSLIFDSSISFRLKVLMLSDLFWNYGYYSYFKKAILNKKNVLSFFSTSQLAFSLHEACKDINKPFIFYSWGSNQGFEEFKYSSADITLVKNSYDFNLFSRIGSYGKLIKFGDLSLSDVKNTRDLFIKNTARILIVDTCLSSKVNAEKKFIIYKRIFDSLSSVSSTFTVRPHPATRVCELSELLSKFSDDVLITNEKSIFEQAQDADLVININSTVGIQLISLGIPVYEIYDEGYAYGYLNEEYPGLVFSNKNNVYPGDKVFFSEKLESFMLSQGIMPADLSLLNNCLRRC
ncbi:hypothetical protein [Vibrio chemaguriensis]